MEYRDEVGDQVVTMRKIVQHRVSSYTERKNTLPSSIKRLGSQGSFLDAIVGRPPGTHRELHVRMLGEKMGVLGHVAFCESMISGEKNIDIIYLP